MPRSLHVVRPAVVELEPRRVLSVTFAAQQTFATGNVPLSVAVADFDGDGRPDLAVVNAIINTVSVLLDTTPAGAATASFAPRQTFAVGSGPVAVAVGDFDGDGRPDLAVCNVNDNTVSILLNTTTVTGTVSFAAPQMFAVGSLPRGLAVADFNGDGRPDLVVANTGSPGPPSNPGNTVSVLLNTTVFGSGTVSFAAQQTFAVGSFPLATVAADLNGDGRPDLAVATAGSNSVPVLLNTTPAGSATASFAAPQTFAVGTDPESLAVADFNGDGRPDLAAANAGNGLGTTVSVLLNTTTPGAGSASFAAQKTFAVGTAPLSVVVGDFDGDGRPDLAVADIFPNTVSVLVNTTSAGATTPSFAAQQTFAVGTRPYAAAVADFNGDGRPDLGVINSGDKTVSVLLNTTAPFVSTVPVVVGQFDGQGVWQFNRSLGTWVQLTAANASLLAADPDGDVAGDFPGYGVWLYRPTTGWNQINGFDATILAMDANGDVAAQFPGFGVGEFLPAFGWRLLTGANASLLAMDALGDVVGEFPGYGVWEFRPAAGFTQIHGADVTLLAMDPLGDVAANFPGVGVAEFFPSAGWGLLNGNQAKALTMDGRGGVEAVFQGFGTAVFSPLIGWRTQAPVNAEALATDPLGDVFCDFIGSGVWEFDPYRGWILLTGADATVLATG
jgi:hypothetical protein